MRHKRMRTEVRKIPLRIEVKGAARRAEKSLCILTKEAVKKTENALRLFYAVLQGTVYYRL